MRIPLSWLAEYVDLPTDEVAVVEQALIGLGVEVEDIHRLDAGMSGPIVLGRVAHIEELSQFKKPIRYCRVDIGGEDLQGIVCGAMNFAVDDLVVVALPGSELPGGFAISARTTYDHVSDGMICSARELGLGEDHAGIMVLPADPDARPGTDARLALGLTDPVLELSLTPDRGDLLSVRGLARELGLGLGVASTDPAAVDQPAWDGAVGHEVRVADPAGCPRFTGLVLTGLDPEAPSPAWLTRRLTQAGIRSVSLPVDVTNFVMVELGQPMHAFDLDTVHGPIVVRRAEAGERLTTLDGVDRALVGGRDLLITDDSGPIGLAAVMGGLGTEISATTHRVFLEAAHWDPATVSRTARGHGLFSEAAQRFERFVDPALTVPAIARAAALLVEYAGAEVDGGLVDLDERPPRPEVRIDAGLPARISGVDYPASTVRSVLESLGARVVEGEGAELVITPPSWRADLSEPHDVVEEVVRLTGYEAVPSVLPTAPAGRGLTAAQRHRRSIARTLADLGYVESPAYPFVGDADFDALGLVESDPRRNTQRLANPISDAEPLLRTTMLPGLLKSLRRNLGRGQRDVALFEVGRLAVPRTERTNAPIPGTRAQPSAEDLAAIDAALPAQPWALALVSAGAYEQSGWWGPGRPADWSDLLAALEAAGRAANAQLRARKAAIEPWHPGRCAELVVEVDGVDVVVGHAGELHPGVLAALELPAGACAAELDLDRLPVAPVPEAAAISAFPPVRLDVAVVVATDVPAGEVFDALRAGAGELLEDLRLFDVYTGAQVPDGAKSLAFALDLRAPDRTLTVEEATTARDSALAEAGRRVGARLRS